MLLFVNFVDTYVFVSFFHFDGTSLIRPLSKKGYVFQDNIFICRVNVEDRSFYLVLSYLSNSYSFNIRRLKME